MKYEPHLMLIYLDNALREGEITDEQWIEQRNEWLVYLDELENSSSNHWGK